MANGVFLILCGIPASGKTSFAKELIKMNWEIQGKTVNFIHVSYDDFIADKSVESSQSMDPPKEWKTKRRQIVKDVEALVFLLKSDDICDKETSSKGFAGLVGQSSKTSARDSCHVIVIDDNMFYRSMRYEYYQLARKVNFGFAQIYLHCDPDVAIRRNNERCNPVTMETIHKMCAVLEKPASDKFTWEKYTICGDVMSLTLKEKWNNVHKLIETALCDTPQPVKILNEHEKAKAREITQKNMLHQADLVLRKIISEKIKHIDENKSEKASVLNKHKKLVMETLKQDILQIFTVKHDMFTKMTDNVVTIENVWETVTFDEFTWLVGNYFGQYC